MTAELPGLTVEVAPPVAAAAAARGTDVAGFIGGPLRARRAMGTAGTVSGASQGSLNGYRDVFGEPRSRGRVHALRGQRVLRERRPDRRVIRVAGRREPDGVRDLGPVGHDGQVRSRSRTASRGRDFESVRLAREAGQTAPRSRSPTAGRGFPGHPRSMSPCRLPVSWRRRFGGILPDSFVNQINATSTLVRVAPVEGSELKPATGLDSLTLTQILTLDGGYDDPPTQQTYLDAIQSMGDESEVAFLAMPDLFDDIKSDDGRLNVLAAAVALADQKQDRLVLVERTTRLVRVEGHHPLGRFATSVLPVGKQPVLDGDVAFGGRVPPLALGSRSTRHHARRLAIVDSAVGACPGVISRLDRQHGAHYTPANTALLQAFDVAQGFRVSDRGC